jgi:hypothetical protein
MNINLKVYKMISGFGASRGPAFSHDIKHLGDGKLPVPFNIPNVLHNLLFENTGIEFDNKQKDVMEALRFSYNALQKMATRYAQKEQELLQKILKDPDNKQLKNEQEELQLEKFEAYNQFKDLVITIAELLTKEQYQTLMEFSKYPG